MIVDYYVWLSFETATADLGDVQCHYSFQVEQHISLKQCAAGFEVCFLSFSGCVGGVPNQLRCVYT